jgi:predicted DNA-binding transcriptional regulator YafY
MISLFQARRYWSGQDLSERLQVDVRTVRRDVDRLRDLGYPVAAASGPGGGYQLGAGADMPPVLLDDDEAVAVAVALRAAAGSVGKIEETSVRLLAKLDQLLPARLRRRASALHSVTISLSTPGALPDADLLTRIAAACRDQECLRFGYQDRAGKPSTREVEPMRLANSGRRWYLAAWDRRREDWRTFRLDRITPPLIAGERFQPRTPPEDLATYIARSISQAPYRYQIRVRLPGPASQMAEFVPSWCGVLEAVDEHSCILRTGADNADFLVAQLLIPGVEFEIIEDAGLGDEIRAVIERLQRALPGAKTGSQAPASREKGVGKKTRGKSFN